MENINVSTPNDGLGDKIRDAFIKVNENFLLLQDILDLDIQTQIDDILLELNNKSDIIHTHIISQITGLQIALDNKVNTSDYINFNNTINQAIININDTLNEILAGGGSGGGGLTYNDFKAQSPLLFNLGTYSIQNATATQSGALTSTDWNTFNNKVGTSSIANLIPYTGATQDVELGEKTITMNNGVTDTQMSPAYFGVEYADGLTFSILEADKLTVHNSTSNMEVNATGLKFPDASTQTTAVIKTSQLQNDGDNGTSHFISMEDLPANIILYPTTATSDISGYSKIVTSITDTDYDDIAVDITTGSISTTNVLIASLSTSPNVIVGNPGIFNITTIGNIKRTAGSGSAEFYFKVFKRDNSGTETLIATSNATQQITSSAYAEFSATALWNDGIFLDTDRIVLKFYGSKVGGSSSPTYDFQFGGTSPVRTLLPIPLSVVPSYISVEGLSNMSDVSYTTPVDADSLLIKDNTNSLWKRLTWANVKSNLKTYFDSLYAPKASTTKIVINDTTDSASFVGVAFAENKAKEYTIPANTFGPTDLMRFYLSLEKDLQNGGVVVEVKMSNSSTFIPGTAASSRVLRSVTQSVFFSTLRYVGISRIFNKFNGSGTLIVPSISTLTDQAGSLTVQTGNNTVPLDPTQPIYVWITLSNFSALDTTKVTSFLLTN